MLLFCIYCHVKCAFFVWVWACVWNRNHESNWLLRMLSLLDRLKIHTGKSHGLKMASLWRASLAGLMKLEEKGLGFAMPLSCEWMCVLKGKRKNIQVLVLEAQVENACYLRLSTFGPVSMLLHWTPSSEPPGRANRHQQLVSSGSDVGTEGSHL